MRQRPSGAITWDRTSISAYTGDETRTMGTGVGTSYFTRSDTSLDTEPLLIAYCVSQCLLLLGLFVAAMCVYLQNGRLLRFEIMSQKKTFVGLGAHLEGDFITDGAPHDATACVEQRRGCRDARQESVVWDVLLPHELQHKSRATRGIRRLCSSVGHNETRQAKSDYSRGPLLSDFASTRIKAGESTIGEPIGKWCVALPSVHSSENRCLSANSEIISKGKAVYNV